MIFSNGVRYIMQGTLCQLSLGCICSIRTRLYVYFNNVILLSKYMFFNKINNKCTGKIVKGFYFVSEKFWHVSSVYLSASDVLWHSNNKVWTYTYIFIYFNYTDIKDLNIWEIENNIVALARAPQNLLVKVIFFPRI